MNELLKCLLITGTFLLWVNCLTAQNVYISPAGNDKHAGTKEAPKASIHAALRHVREWRRLNDSSIANGANIIVEDGLYNFPETLVIRPEDAGTANSPTTIKSAEGANPVFSGGINLRIWKKSETKIERLPSTAQENVWVADVPNTGPYPFESRQLYVNGKKATRAKHTKGIEMERIHGWDFSTGTCKIPNQAINLNEAKGLELFIHQWWAIAILRIKEINQTGDTTYLRFHDPESKIQNEHPWPAPWISKETGNSAFILSNAIELLDEPGEWFLDIAQGKIYYWPLPGEDMRKASTVMPHIETLIAFEGNAEKPVSYFSIQGIRFQHTGWLRPSQQGHVPHQAGLYMTEAYKLRPAGTPEKPTLDNQAWIGRPGAAVSLNYAHNIRIEGCHFHQLASTGIDADLGVQHSQFTGNIFREIGGTAILAGFFGNEGHEVHLPYNPQNKKDISHLLNISNNLITNAGTEDWSVAGIAAGYISESKIENNDISNVPYSGISLGWGWTPQVNMMRNNSIKANKITHYGKHNYDCAGIYTLSAQPGTRITENYIDSIYKAPYAHLPGHWFYVYTDEGSAYMTISDNWTPSQKFLKNSNGPECVWTNNGPQVDAYIKENAGLQAKWHSLKSYKAPADEQYAINKDYPVAIEWVETKNNKVDKDKLLEIFAKSKVPKENLYQWKDRFVIFGHVEDAFILNQRLKNAFTNIAFKSFEVPFYDFNRTWCGEKQSIVPQKHILLTANLVADTSMQAEYLKAHASQQTNWPEIGKGFCNASFQQLLIYKHERQLFLVISIPETEDFESLNKKTSENNPKMMEWNKIMGKYQTGVAGTKKNETWVFYSPSKLLL